ncbi:MAG: hypothetical protein ABDH63_04060 [Candidatus Caldarchaeales archaeon]
MLDALTQQYVVHGLTLMAGMLIGYGTARALRGLALVLTVIIVAHLLGLALADAPPIRTILVALRPVVDSARSALGPLLSYPLFFVGFLVGLAFGLAK